MKYTPIIFGILIGFVVISTGFLLYKSNLRRTPVNNDQISSASSAVVSDTVATSPEPIPNLAIDTSLAVGEYPEYIKNSNVYFQKDTGVYKVSLRDFKPEKMFDGKIYAISHDQKTVAYVKEFGPDSTNKSETILYFYNPQTKITTTLNTGLEFMRNVIWSPDDQYIFVDSGEGVVGNTLVYNAQSHFKMFDFPSVGEILWINNNTFIKNTLHKLEVKRTAENGDAVGIAKVALPSGVEEQLISPDNLSDSFANYVEGSDLIYTKTFAEKASDWEFYNVKTRFYKFSLIARTSMEINSIKSTLYEKAIPPDIVNKLPIPETVKSAPITGVENATHPGWFVLNIKGEFYIVNIKDSANTFKRIGDGHGFDWRY